ncbi:hypothetical protein GIB67_036113 [Kingdonia uniflora]|uniref:non-specific serine/threonine protein kinase n=1 Tax=Kingdonia uniflora TaxID=39325 RepID=A0A7J7N982_9MAGN|nr:hypothetical protein GIB67_036113 [Kingdonia uniflora]
MKHKELKKDIGCSWIEIEKERHYFYGGDDRHPLTDKIHGVLLEMERRIKEEAGYVYGGRFALHDVDEESKEDSLRVHSEKLAIGLGLLCGGLKEGGLMRVFKNLRLPPLGGTFKLNTDGCTLGNPCYCGGLVTNHEEISICLFLWVWVGSNAEAELFVVLYGIEHFHVNNCFREGNIPDPPDVITQFGLLKNFCHKNPSFVETREHRFGVMATKLVYLFLFALFIVVGGSQAAQSRLIRLGSSLSAATNQTWRSPSGRFAFGFYKQGTGFVVGIWLVGDPENTIIWTANRDDPPVSSNATLFLNMDGKLLLETRQGRDIVIAHGSGFLISSASMLDSGNFVLYDNKMNIIWESFSFPTDTIVGGQDLLTGHELISSVSRTICSTGRFRLKMQVDGNLVLYPLHTQDVGQDAYWATNVYGTKMKLSLNNTGILQVLNDTGTILKPLLPVTSLLLLKCLVKGICGFNSYCTYVDTERDCRCLPGFNDVDPNDKSQGCQRSFPEPGTGGCSKTTNKSAALYNITSMDNMFFGDIPYFEVKETKEACISSCLDDCNCATAIFEEGSCKKQALPLRYVRRNEKVENTAFFRTSASSNNNTRTVPPMPVLQIPTKTESKKDVILILVVSLSFITCSSVAIVVFGFVVYKARVLRYRELSEKKSLGLTEEFTLRLFSYDELYKATDGFKEELGRGSFGKVYKGSLSKGRQVVAVKRLEKVVEEGEREFRAEMKSIGRTHHRNLVQLLGYCAEGSKRLLVYEYMGNGSLAELLFKTERRPDWDERVRITLGVARGILYLHEECESRIIHCDIKPQNILMDDFWTPKISDFGLAKHLMPDQTRTFTEVRGTRGYLAPEWQKNTPISVKADVYSFGVVLLEIVCCRKNLDASVATPEEIILSLWVFKCFVAKELNKLVGNEEVDMNTMERMIKVGLWCIQDEPVLRPSMKTVILMLEGIKEISIPPSPSLPSLDLN